MRFHNPKLHDLFLFEFQVYLKTVEDLANSILKYGDQVTQVR